MYTCTYKKIHTQTTLVDVSYEIYTQRNNVQSTMYVSRVSSITYISSIYIDTTYISQFSTQL